jgi:hypothetical protein
MLMLIIFQVISKAPEIIVPEVIVSEKIQSSLQNSDKTVIYCLQFN